MPGISGPVAWEDVGRAVPAPSPPHDILGSTLRPNGAGSYRAWNTPVHEFGHAIEETLGLHARTANVHSANRDDYKRSIREYFAWGTQEWFASAADAKWNRDMMNDWEHDYLATVFDVENAWVPKCTR